ncbi:MAG: bifunctional NADP-dependent methylenetetrahydromethanopterin dehydrogenase/methylenetetrahydrofolate dehydrogenase [Planctomycetaceae bacterium]|nr:bifunctional NADP-dependent methylenetetrahydromethanopterin dehydrogenase/methylenetetrahydrofolate dehydrogenase [Planctomycetaceae bacterium]
MNKILVQLDTDHHPAVFDRVVAVDSDVEQLFSYGSVTCENVTGLVHGTMFTRGPADLKNTAIFVGGSQVADAERLMKKVQSIFFGPMRVSVMMDSNGCNTTAAAAIASAKKHIPLADASAVVLGATGPVGLRVAELLAMEKAHVTIVSRTMDRAQAACNAILQRLPNARLTPAVAVSHDEFEQVSQNKNLLVAAGAAGTCFLPEGALQRLSVLQVAIDLNAVPPVGIADVGVTDKATDHSGVICYGALGVGGLKMKVHKRAVRQLFESNDQVLDTYSIYTLALQVAGLT